MTLVEWLNAAIEEDERAARADFDVAPTRTRQKALRTVQAHREILDRHAPMDPEGCDRCSDVCGDYVASWPCPDALSLLKIYEGAPGFDPSWIEERSGG